MRHKKYVLAFLATALAGLAVRVYAQTIVTTLFDAEPGDWLFALVREIGGLFLPALIALLVGYLLPKGFFLWGIAVVLLHPFHEAFWDYRAAEAGAIEYSELNRLFLGQTIQIVLFAGACTGAAALSAGLRLLWWWIRGRPFGRPRAAPEGPVR